jgi:hypothetical protein
MAFCTTETEQLPHRIFVVWSKTKQWLKYKKEKKYESLDTFIFMADVLRFASKNENAWGLLSEEATDDSSCNKNFKTIQSLYVDVI